MANKKQATEHLRRISDILMLNANLLENSGLLNGKTGIALFFFHLARETGDGAYEEYAGKMIDQAGESLNQMTVRYKDGLAGFGVGLEYLIKQRFVDADADEVMEDIDVFILHHTLYNLPSTPEICAGITGFGKYYTERLSNRIDVANDAPKKKYLSEIIRSLSCSYNTYRDLLSVIDFLSGVIPLGVESEKAGAYLDYAADKMETMVYEDMHFGNYPGDFNPLIAAAVLCRASEKTGNRIYSDRARRYLQQYESGLNMYLSSNFQINALKWSFLYRYLGGQFQDGELLKLSEKWLTVSLTAEFERNPSMGLLDGIAGAGMYLLSLTGRCCVDWFSWLDMIPCYVEKATSKISMP